MFSDASLSLGINALFLFTDWFTDIDILFSNINVLSSSIILSFNIGVFCFTFGISSIWALFLAGFSLLLTLFSTVSYILYLVSIWHMFSSNIRFLFCFSIVGMSM